MIYTLSGPDDLESFSFAPELLRAVRANFEIVWKSLPSRGGHKIGLTDVKVFADMAGLQFQFDRIERSLTLSNPRLIEALMKKREGVDYLSLSINQVLEMREEYVNTMNMSTNMVLDVILSPWVGYYVPIVWDLTFEDGGIMKFQPRLKGEVINGPPADMSLLSCINKRLTTHVFYA